MPSSKSSEVFRLKGSQFTLPVLHLLRNDIENLKRQLLTTIQQNPTFFQHAPIIVDLSELKNVEKNDFLLIYEILREQGLIPVGIIGINQQQQDQIRNLGLAILSASSGNTQSVTTKGKKEPKAKSIEPPKIVDKLPAKIITQPVRSGQQIYAANSDLIILASVSTGAEILADGHIHVYGALRGRALAGIKGNTQARIFCNPLEAELISIAGRFLLSEAFEKTKQATQIYLEADKLCISAIPIGIDF